MLILVKYMTNINLTKCYNIFNKYVQTFNLNDTKIKGKQQHTFRVIKYAEIIAKSLNLTNNEIDFIKLCALLHDIGRFYQWQQYHTFQDNISIDHAKKGVEILKNNNYINEYTNQNHDLLYKVILNHNKYAIDKKLTKYEKQLANIIRDADKIDIMLTQANDIDPKNIPTINKTIYLELFNNKLLQSNNIKNKLDINLKQLSFIYDINYPQSFKIITNTKIIELKLNNIKPYFTKEEITKLKKRIN